MLRQSLNSAARDIFQKTPLIYLCFSGTPVSARNSFGGNHGFGYLIYL